MDGRYRGNVTDDLLDRLNKDWRKDFYEDYEALLSSSCKITPMNIETFNVADYDTQHHEVVGRRNSLIDVDVATDMNCYCTSSKDESSELKFENQTSSTASGETIISNGQSECRDDLDESMHSLSSLIVPTNNRHHGHHGHHGQITEDEGRMVEDAPAQSLGILDSTAPLNSVHLYGCLLEEDIAKLAVAITNNRTVTTLSLLFQGEHESSNTNSIIQPLLTALQYNTTIQDLVINGIDISPEQAQHLCQLFNIHSLNINVTNGNISLLSSELANNTTLQALSLSSSHITDDGIQDLVHALKINNTLESLDLRKNHLTDIGIGQIATALLHNDTLKVLKLGRNNLTNQGVIELSNALTYNTTLEYLTLCHCQVQNSGARAIAKAIQSNRQSNLKSLDLRNSGITNIGARELSHVLKCNTVLEELYLSDNGISDNGANLIAEAILMNDLTSMHSLYISRNYISPDCVSYLEETLPLRYLNLKDNIASIKLNYDDDDDESIETLLRSVTTSADSHKPTSKQVQTSLTIDATKMIDMKDWLGYNLRYVGIQGILLLITFYFGMWYKETSMFIEDDSIDIDNISTEGYARENYFFKGFFIM